MSPPDPLLRAAEPDVQRLRDLTGARARLDGLEDAVVDRAGQLPALIASQPALDLSGCSDAM